MRALHERHNLTHDSKERKLRKGDVMLMKGDEKNRGQRKIGIIGRRIAGRDEVIRSARLRAGKPCKERPIQFLYPLELHCDPKDEIPLNPTAKKFQGKGKALKD